MKVIRRISGFYDGHSEYIGDVIVDESVYTKLQTRTQHAQNPCENGDFLFLFKRQINRIGAPYNMNNVSILCSICLQMRIMTMRELASTLFAVCARVCEADYGSHKKINTFDEIIESSYIHALRRCHSCGATHHKPTKYRVII